MKIIIDRANWNVSFRLNKTSSLLCDRNSKCCLGFMGTALGFSDERIRNRTLPSPDIFNILDRKWPDKLFEPSGFTLISMYKRFNFNYAEFFAHVNDSKGIDIALKEEWIAAGFKILFDIEVEFK